MRHQFARSVGKATLAGSPLFPGALPLAAVKFAKSGVLRDLLDNLASEPPPDSANWLAAFRVLFGHAAKPSRQIKGLPRLSGIIHPNRRLRNLGVRAVIRIARLRFQLTRYLEVES